jgi:hypothetical protein
VNGYGVCFEFEAPTDEAAERVRAAVERLVNDIVDDLDNYDDLEEVTRPCWYRFDSRYTSLVRRTIR